MTKTLPLFLGFIVLLLLSLGTRYFKVKMDLRRLTFLVAVSFLLGYMLFYTAAWRLLISSIRMLACTSTVGIAVLLAGVLLAMRGGKEQE